MEDEFWIIRLLSANGRCCVMATGMTPLLLCWYRDASLKNLIIVATTGCASDSIRAQKRSSLRAAAIEMEDSLNPSSIARHWDLLLAVTPSSAHSTGQKSWTVFKMYSARLMQRMLGCSEMNMSIRADVITVWIDPATHARVSRSMRRSLNGYKPRSNPCNVLMTALVSWQLLSVVCIMRLYRFPHRKMLNRR